MNFGFRQMQSSAPPPRPLRKPTALAPSGRLSAHGRKSIVKRKMLRGEDACGDKRLSGNRKRELVT